MSTPFTKICTSKPPPEPECTGSTAKRRKSVTRSMLEVQRELGSRRAAAHEDAALRRCLQRIGVVRDRAGEQAALAVVADAVAAAEGDRDVAGLGEIEQGAEALVPGHADIAAREHDRGAGAGRAVGRMRWTVAVLDDPRRVDGGDAERLGG